MAREQRTPKSKIIAQSPTARSRERRARETGQRATLVYYDRRTGRVMMELTSGYVFGFPATAIPSLASATPAQLAGVDSGQGGSCAGQWR